MTPREREIVRGVEDAAAEVVASFDREHVPNATGFAIACQVAITMLERIPDDYRTEIAAALIARLSATQHYDA